MPYFEVASVCESSPSGIGEECRCRFPLPRRGAGTNGEAVGVGRGGNSAKGHVPNQQSRALPPVNGAAGGDSNVGGGGGGLGGGGGGGGVSGVFESGSFGGDFGVSAAQKRVVKT